MRAVSNLGIAIGAAAVAAALVLFEPFPYDALFIGMACAEGLGVFFLLRAPQPRRARATPRSNVGAFSVFGNRGFTVFVVGIAAISTLYLILDFLLPLWISTASSHDIVLIPTAIVINTTLVVLFQVPVSSTSDTPTRAAKALGFAGGLLLSAALLFALSAVTVSVTAAVVFCIAVAVLTFAELLTSAAGWTLSYAYAPPERIGAYQGVFGFGTSLGVMTAPIALTAIVIRPSAESTALGWALLGGGYALIGLLLWIMVRRHFFNTTLRPSAAQ